MGSEICIRDSVSAVSVALILFIIDPSEIVAALRQANIVLIGWSALAVLAAGMSQGVHVVDIERRKPPIDACRQPLVRKKLAIGIGGGGETVGHPHMGAGQPLDHLSQRGILATNPPNIVHPEMLEANRPFDHCVFLLPCAKQPSGYILPEGYAKIR